MADFSAEIQSLKYQTASNVNVSNFVSEKLSADGNYPLWKAQMLCLMESQQMRGIVDNLFDDPGATHFKTVKQYESLLKGWIFGSLTPDVLKVVVGLQSAKDVWRRLQSIYDEEVTADQDPDSQTRFELSGPYTSQPFIRIELPRVSAPLNIETRRRNKKLLKASMEGRWWEAKSILEEDGRAAIEAVSDEGNTMLHLAVERGHNDFVKQFLDFIDDGRKIEKKNSDGRTALHIAAIVGNKRAAELLVEKRKELVGIADHKAIVPLVSAYYNMKLETFAYLLDATESSEHSHPLGFNPSSDPLLSKVNLLITLIFTKQYNLASTWVHRHPELVTRDDKVLMAMVKAFPAELGFVEALIYPSLSNVRRKILNRCSLLFHSYDYVYSMAKDIVWARRESESILYRWLSPEIVMIFLVSVAMFYPIYQLINLFILVFFYPFLVLHLILWKILATVVAPIKHIGKKKKDYMAAKEIFNLHVVKEILFRSPKTIASMSHKDHNIIQLAVIHRSEKVYNLVCQFVERVDLSILDSSKNNMLHLAGRLAPSSVLDRTTGAALQLQRELQWHEEVKKFMSPKELLEKNVDMETPKMVFTREHKTLMKEGEKWMKTTAESCSITAALITTIVFAAAITVPGGSNQQTGIPLFRNEVAFTIFAISDAISLFASSTALLVFLSILTARFSPQDFLVSLPRRLIIGLCTLFLSTIAMMVAFSAILFLVFCDQRAWMLAPIGGLACFPVAVIVTLQFPLVVDLILSTYHPIFLAECSKSNMNIMRSSFTTQISDRVPSLTSANHAEQRTGFIYVEQPIPPTDPPTNPPTATVGPPSS